ncbi:hypothetical protein DSLPV1_218 [Dishui lake phycodnavirus 1]|uniref:hypothetical protein n=1 Tax=Dishui lake phycodnavirus 1 TaxID=2079134 RepID=UPI000CD6985C|nr:hypothetical protein C5Y57_gp180 [Dishui lake phycodnavirus 1]AUT19189.1 hypothetical protein DSLPV1_218 [Dishui lake phycodnavirus 1]
MRTILLDKKIDELCALRAKQRAQQQGQQPATNAGRRSTRPTLTSFGYGGPATGNRPTAIRLLSSSVRREALLRAHQEGGWTYSELLERLRYIYSVQPSTRSRVQNDIQFILDNPMLFGRQVRRRRG